MRSCGAQRLACLFDGIMRAAGAGQQLVNDACFATLQHKSLSSTPPMRMSRMFECERYTAQIPRTFINVRSDPKVRWK